MSWPRKAFFDAPPTAGLPLQLSDLYPARHADLPKALASFLGVEAVLLESSGTAALVVALMTLKARAPERTKVIIPAYTCPLVALAIQHCQLQACLCDLVPDSLELDPQLLEGLCDEATLAIIPTHLGGRIAEVQSAQRCARAVGAWVIEDAAQAFGAHIDGASVGRYSDMAFFSLTVGKGLTIFEGGVLMVQDPDLRQQCREISRVLAPPHVGLELRRSIELLGYAALYRPFGLRLAYGIPLRRALKHNDWIAAADEYFTSPITLHAVGQWRQAVGVRALARLPAFWDQCRRQAEQRMERLRALGQIQLLEHERGQGVWPILMLLMPTQAARDEVLKALWGQGYGLSIPFVHALPDYQYLVGRLTLQAPYGVVEAQRLAGRLLAITNSAWLSDADFEVVCAALKQAIERS